MQHTNKIAILVLSREFHDYPRNDWHYDREYNLIVKALNEQEKLNKSEVISSVCDCKRLENGKIVMCQKCLVDLTEIE